MTTDVLSPAPCWLDHVNEDISDLEGRLQNRFRGRIRYLQLSVENGCSVLRGQTRTFYLKQLAQHAVMELTRLPIRANEIVVK